MPKNQLPSPTSSPDSGDESSVAIPAEEGFDLYSFRKSEEGKRLTAWASNQFSRCKTAKSRKQSLWYTNMAFYFGHQWIDIIGASNGVAGRIKAKAAPAYVSRKTINRTRSYVRTEQSKFLSTLPTVSAVPSTSEEEDVRAAYAAEQTWQSYSTKRRLRREYSKAVWWMIVTGNGFLKTWWDPTLLDPSVGEEGDINYKSISPFHIFVPDLREQEIDDQPYLIQAQVKPRDWCLQAWPEELKGEEVQPTQVSANTLLDDAFLNLADTPKSELDACVILEVWVKPGATKDLPKGGLLILVEDTLVSAHIDGIPYQHGEYPYTKIEHLSNDTFFADSPLVDLIELQKEYNESRTQISLSAKRMGSPQLLAQQGSIVTGRLTNEPGMVINYRPGTPMPQPMPLQPLPEYIINNQHTILQDFEDLSGQHEVSKGKTPTGVSAGTALAFLKETDDNYLTPQYQNIEDGFERVAKQTLVLFQQYVDVKRKIKVVGEDGSFDTALLQGADIAGATDIRVEPGSSIGQSMAAKRAAVMDMFSVGILQDPVQALRLLEVGGAQKVLDTISVAEKKAQRENSKMKALKTPEGEEQLQEYMQEAAMSIIEPMVQQLNEVAPMDPEAAVDPMTGMPEQVTPESVMQDPELMSMIQEQIPPMIPADDFDMHEIHIDVHNRYRMGQEYETLPDPVKAEFDKHVEMHKMLLQQMMMEQAMMQGGFPPMGEEDPDADPNAAPDNMGQDPAEAQPVM